jgi:peroxiredoxin
MKEGEMSPAPKTAVMARLVLCLAALVFSVNAYAAEPPKAGDVLAAFEMPPPADAAEAEYLGVSQGKSFSFKDVGAPFLLIEVIGVYCPICFKQAPLMDKLFKKIQADPGLSQKVRMLGLATGATPQELAYLKKQKLYAFPVVNDPDYAAHKSIGEPKTPFTMLVDKNGKVLLTHLGLIDDLNAFFREISAAAQ